MADSSPSSQQGLGLPAARGRGLEVSPPPHSLDRQMDKVEERVVVGGGGEFNQRVSPVLWEALWWRERGLILGIERWMNWVPAF